MEKMEKMEKNEAVEVVDTIEEVGPTPEQVEALRQEASEMHLNRRWVLWRHELRNKNWTIESYQKLYTVETVSDLMTLCSCFARLDYRANHFFLMAEGVEPIWEDPNNRHGGVCSFKTEIVPMSQSGELSVVPVWGYLMMRLLGETCVDDSDDLTGMSISPKNNWAIIKIWNRNAKNDLSQTLATDIKARFSELSIKYKPNAPEY